MKKKKLLTAAFTKKQIEPNTYLIFFYTILIAATCNLACSFVRLLVRFCTNRSTVQCKHTLQPKKKKKEIERKQKKKKKFKQQMNEQDPFAISNIY